MLLYTALGNEESYTAWQGFIWEKQLRGLPPLVLVTTNGAPGVIGEVEEACPESHRQGCLARKIRNAIDKVSYGAKAEFNVMAQRAHYVLSREVGELTSKDLMDPHQSQYPTMMKACTEDLEAC